MLGAFDLLNCVPELDAKEGPPLVNLVQNEIAPRLTACYQTVKALHRFDPVCYAPGKYGVLRELRLLQQLTDLLPRPFVAHEIFPSRHFRHGRMHFVDTVAHQLSEHGLKSFLLRNFYKFRFEPPVAQNLPLVINDVGGPHLLDEVGWLNVGRDGFLKTGVGVRIFSGEEQRLFQESRNGGALVNPSLALTLCRRMVCGIGIFGFVLSLPLMLRGRMVCGANGFGSRLLLVLGHAKFSGASRAICALFVHNLSAHVVIDASDNHDVCHRQPLSRMSAGTKT